MRTRYSFLLLSRFFVLLFFSSFSIISLSQETSTCAENLRSAQTLFDNGQVEQVPGMLEECLRSGFKQEEELTAYKLIIQTFLFQDRYGEADSAMLAFLKKYPEYQLSPTDHSSFVYQFNCFNVKPLVQLTLHLGTTIPFLTFITPHSTSSETLISSYSSDALNLTGILEATFRLKGKFDLNIEAGYMQSSFVNTEEYMDFSIITYEEIQHRLITPLSVTYNFADISKITFYGKAGAGPSFNISTTSKALFESSSREPPKQEIDRRDSRIGLDLFCLAGAGVKLKTPGGYFSFDVRSDFGIFNQVVRGGASAEKLANDFFYEDDDFNINHLSITLGYTQIFFKPSKNN